MMRVCLMWDIDGTLLDTNGLGVVPFEEAIRSQFPKAHELIRGKYSGFTDFEIIADLTGDKLSDSADIETYLKVLTEYTASLEEKFKSSSAKPIGNIEETLFKLRQVPWITSYIVTGNYEPAGWLKLKSAGLDKFFTEQRYFGSDLSRMTRRDVVKYAKESLKGYGDLIVIGDTPSDILAANFNGLKIIGVPTGHHEFKTLNQMIPGNVLSKVWGFDNLLTLVTRIQANSL
jgi:phosphoglycolate phosphatase